MIYVVEIPHQHPPKCWAKENEAELIKAIYATAEAKGVASSEIYDETTGEELLTSHGHATPEEAREAGDGWIADLIERHGPIETLYTAWGDHGHYSDEPAMSEMEACDAWLGEDLNRLIILYSDEEAQEELKLPWVFHGGAEAKERLRHELSFWREGK